MTKFFFSEYYRTGIFMNSSRFAPTIIEQLDERFVTAICQPIAVVRIGDGITFSRMYHVPMLFGSWPSVINGALFPMANFVLRAIDQCEAIEELML